MEPILTLLGVALIIACWQYKNKDIEKKTPNLKASGYKLVYTDQKGDFDAEKIIVSEMLVSEKYSLRGKPDYIFLNKSKKDMLVVELKSGKIGKNTSPHKGDLMQLISYFVMIEDIFSISPREGRIIYKDYMFVVKNTKEFKKELFKIIEDMHQMLADGKNTANPSFATCRYCICNGTVCEHCKIYRST